MNPSDFPFLDLSEVEGLEILLGGNTILFQGEVLCLRFLHCITCDNVNSTPVFINLSKQEERLTTVTELISPCPQCENSKLEFISLEEIIFTGSDGNSNDFDGD